MEKQYGQSSRGSSKDQETNLRLEIEREFNQRLVQLRNMYEMRIQSFQESLKQAFKLVQQDELVDTMKQDETSEEFISLRVKEIIEEVLYGDREAMLDKLTSQHSNLRVEFGKLEQENAKTANDMKELEQLFTKKYDDLQRQYEVEMRDREFWQREVENLKASIQEMERNFEESQRKKDDGWVRRLDKENEQVNSIREKLYEAEGRIREKEMNYLRVCQENEMNIKNIEVMKNIQKEKEFEIQNVKNELNSVEQKYRELSKTATELDSLRIENNKIIQELSEENNQLKAEKDHYSQSRQFMEEKYQKQIEDISKDYQEEIENQKNNNEKMQKKQKEKIDQYKKKLIEYKDRVTEKDFKLQELTRKIEEDKIINEKNTEILHLKMQEQRETNEHRLVMTEEEYHKKMNEMQIKHEDQLRELQNHFQGLLEQKIGQIQNDASNQISQLKNQERELENILEEKIIQLERDYVKSIYHQQIVNEKDHLIEKLKNELASKEIEFKHEIANKLRVLEEKLSEDFSFAEKKLKNNQSILEENLVRLEFEKKNFEGELKEKMEKIKILQANVEELELQRKKMFEAMEEWGVKSKKIKIAYEEETARRQSLETDVKDQHQKFLEITKLFQETKKEIETKNEQINYLSQELTSYESNYENQSKQLKIIQREHEDLRSSFSLTDSQKNELIRALQEHNERLKDELININDKLMETARIGKEKFEIEANNHFETKNQFRSLDFKNQELNLEIQDLKQKLDLVSANLLDTQNNLNETKTRLSQSENSNKVLAKEKVDLKKRVERNYIQIEELRKNLNLYFGNKIKDIRNEFRDLRSLCSNVVSNLNRESEFKISELISHFKIILDRVHENHAENIKTVRNQQRAEFELNLENLKERYDRIKLELNDSFEHKLFEKEKRIDAYKTELQLLSEKYANLERENNQIHSAYSQSADENQAYKAEISRITHEKDDLNIKNLQYKQKMSQEIQEITDELIRVQEEFNSDKKNIEQNHKFEIDNLKNQYESLKQRFSTAQNEYESKYESLTRTHNKNMEKIEEDTQKRIEDMNEIVQRHEKNEKDLSKKLSITLEEKNKLEKQLQLIQQESQEMKKTYESKLYGMENRLFEIQQNIYKENQKSEEYKSEKKREIHQLTKNSIGLQEEIKLLNERLNDTNTEKNKLLLQIQELNSNLDLKNTLIEQQRLEIAAKAKERAKEIENLQSLLIKSYKTGDSNEKPPLSKGNEINQTHDFTKSIEDLKKIEKYLNNSKSPANLNREGTRKSPFRPSIQSSIVEIDGETKKNLSISQLKP